MVDGHYGTVVDGVFTSADADYGRGYASSCPVPIALLSRGTVVVITLTGKSCFFLVAIAPTNALNYSVYEYNNNHHAAFHYNSLGGRVNSNYDDWMNNGTFARHYVYGGGAPFTAVLTLRGSDRTVSFSINGVQQRGVWALPTTDAFYLMLAAPAAPKVFPVAPRIVPAATGSGSNIAVTDVSVTTDFEVAVAENM